MPVPTPNSSAAGFLPPLNTEVEDDALMNLLQEMVVGITGVQGNLVFPRWQPEPPPLPAFGTDWGALGVTSRRADTFAAEIHYPDNAGDGGHTIVTRHEELDVLVSFYGPHCNSNMANLREGLQLWQNRYTLRANNIGLIGTGDFTRAPELIRQRWLDRVDMVVNLRRQIIRRYAVLDLLSAQVNVKGNRPGGTNTVTPSGIMVTVTE